MEDNNFIQKVFYLFHNWNFYKGNYERENKDMGGGLGIRCSLIFT